MYLTTEGLVLRETAYQDTSKLLTVLTKDHGKLTFKARGVNSRSSKLKAPCQLLAFSEFTVHENKGYYTIYEAEARELFPALRADLELLSLGSYVAQLLETVSQEDWANPALLQLGLGALYALCYRQRPQKLVKAAFELRLMALAGYEPQLDACLFCGSESPDRFNVTMGAVQCAACGTAEDGLRMPIDAGALAAMRYIVRAEAKKVFSFTLGDASLQLLGNATETYLLTQLERGFSTLDFYKSIIL
jgi:DNA repair protein RecO (recombination protein O)